MNKGKRIITKIDDYPRVLLPEDVKVVDGVYIDSEFLPLFKGKEKVAVWFSIQAKGKEYDGKPIHRIYNITPPVSRRFDISKEYERLIGRQLEYREDPSYLDIFKEKKIFKLRIKTVTENWKHEEVAEFQRYSSVESIISAIDKEVSEDEIPF